MPLWQCLLWTLAGLVATGAAFGFGLVMMMAFLTGQTEKVPGPDEQDRAR